MERWKHYLDIKSYGAMVPGADMVLEGLASTYDTDLDNEAVQPGAFDQWLEQYRRNPVILSDHENTTRAVIGRAEEISAGASGLYLKAVIPDLQDPMIQMVRQKIHAGLLRGFSIGGLFTKSGNKITNVQLLEVSVVAIPANPHALFSLAKSLALQANLDTVTTPELELSAKAGRIRRRHRQPLGF